MYGKKHSVKSVAKGDRVGMAESGAENTEAVQDTQTKQSEAPNPLGVEPVGRLLAKFAVPSAIALVVNSLYNVVDQVFIGNFVGELGNAATNIAFPLTTLTMSLGLLFGIGGASAYNLARGEGRDEDAPYYIGNSTSMLFICGIILTVITLVFLTPLLKLFGSPDEVLPYAQVYVFITAFGFPFHLFEAGAGHFVRAAGRPNGSMVVILSGAIVNVLLDTLFVVVFGWGMEGAATATVIGQVVASAVGIWYMARTKTLGLKRKHLVPRRKYTLKAVQLGMAPCINQLAMMVVQIATNNSLKIYGGASVYGESIPIAVVGIITKVNSIFMSTITGVGQGVQPIASYNYGAKKYDRVRKVFWRGITVGFIIGVIMFALFQLFPRQIISLFGEGSSELYYEFAVSYFRIFLMLAFINFLPQVGSTFFTSIGKPTSGTVLSLTRQIIFFLPLLLIFPRIWGIDGILYVGPVADAMAVIVAVIMFAREFRELRLKENEVKEIARENRGEKE